MASTAPNKLVAVPTAEPADAHAGDERNPGTALDLDWVADVRVNLSAVERRAGTIGTRRTVKKQWQAAWLLRAITSKLTEHEQAQLKAALSLLKRIVDTE